MKIVCIGPAHPFRGGIAKFNESFADACNSKGHPTEIITFSYLYPSFLFPGKTQYSDDPAPVNLRITASLSSVNPLTWRRSAHLALRMQPELVVIQYWMPFFAPALGTIARLIRKKKVPVIAIAHNLFPHEKQPGVKMLSGYFLDNIDGIVTLSGSVLKDVHSLRPGISGVYLPHPIYNIYGQKPLREESVKHLGLDPGKKYLLFFGLIRKYKGLDLLIRAFAKLKDENTILLVAGEFYDDSRKYFRLAEEMGVINRIIFSGKFIPDNEVKHYFSVAEAVVQPYITATQSGVTQIAYHFDCPMVVTNVGGLPEMVKDGISGFVCNRDPGELASAVEKSLDPAIRERLIKGIQAEKHRFSWDSFVEKTIGLIGR